MKESFSNNEADYEQEQEKSADNFGVKLIKLNYNYIILSFRGDFP